MSNLKLMITPELFEAVGDLELSLFLDMLSKLFHANSITGLYEFADRVWICATSKYLAGAYPYWSAKQIHLLFTKAEDAGIIKGFSKLDLPGLRWPHEDNLKPNARFWRFEDQGKWFKLLGIGRRSPDTPYDLPKKVQNSQTGILPKTEQSPLAPPAIQNSQMGNLPKTEQNGLPQNVQNSQTGNLKFPNGNFAPISKSPSSSPSSEIPNTNAPVGASGSRFEAEQAKQVVTSYEPSRESRAQPEPKRPQEARKEEQQSFSTVRNYLGAIYLPVGAPRSPEARGEYMQSEIGNAQYSSLAKSLLEKFPFHVLCETFTQLRNGDFLGEAQIRAACRATQDRFESNARKAKT